MPGIFDNFIAFIYIYKYCDDLAGRFLLNFWMVVQAEWQRYVHVLKISFLKWADPVDLKEMCIFSNIFNIWLSEFLKKIGCFLKKNPGFFLMGL